MAGASESQLLPFGSDGPAPPKGHDHDLDRVEDWLRAQRSGPQRFGEVIRRTFDQVLDAERTGRYDLSELSEVELAYLADRFRILLRDEFDLPKAYGQVELSFGIDGVGVESSFEPAAGWMLPAVATSSICLLVTASDETSMFSAGVLRCTPGLVQMNGPAANAALSEDALSQTRWFWRNEAMPLNILRTLPANDIQAIFALPGKRNGQARVIVLFERIHGQIIPRDLVATVAHQNDPMKRARDARPVVQGQGIVILGHQNDHPRILKELDLPVPKKGSFVAVRLVDATPKRQLGGRKVVMVGGKNWVVALPEEPNEPGPEWPY